MTPLSDSAAPRPEAFRDAPAHPGARSVVRFVLIALSVAAVAGFGPLHEHLVPLELAWGGGSLAWLVQVRAPSRVSPVWLVLGAIALRALALTGDPGLSDDAYRYVWEGGLVAEGENPYAHAPDSPALAAYRARWPEIHSGINHRDVSAAYPPLVQGFHAAVTTLAGGPGRAERALLAMRLAYGALDLLCLLPLARLLRRSRHRRAGLVAWAWSPLVALEFAGSGHFDSLGILLLLTALAVLRSDASASLGRRSAGVALLVAGALVKLLPGVLVPFAARGRRAPALLAAAALLFALAWTPFLGDGGGALVAGLSEYGSRWEAGSLVFRWVELPLTLAFERTGGPTDPRFLARLLVGLVFVAIVWREARRPPDPVRGAAVLIGAFLVLSPTLHPWYLAWIVPFVALRGSRAWSVLLVLAPLLYWPLAGWHTEGTWREPVWLWPVLAVPFFVLLLLDARAAGRADSTPDGMA